MLNSTRPVKAFDRRSIASGLVLVLVLAIAGPWTSGPRAGAAQVPRAMPARDSTDGTEVRAIRARRAASNAAIARHDTAGIGASMAPSIAVLSSASQLTVGRQENLVTFAGLFRERRDVVYRRSPAEIRVFAAWGMASEAGDWSGSWTTADGKVEIGGRYFAKWRRIGGAWFIEGEVFVPDRCTGSSFCERAP